MNAINQQQIRDLLKEFDFKRLFVEQLGWENASGTNEVTIKGATYTLESVSKTKGVVVYHCQPTDEGNVPDYQSRRQIERKVTKELAYEHLILFTNDDQSTQIWQWVARQKGKPTACREHSYHPVHQDGEALIQKLNHIHIPLSEFEAIDITGAVHKLKDAFDKDKVTKKFYDRFKKEHTAFLKFIEGIDEIADREWYASLMLNRLMFSYFIQAKGFLDGDKKYLQNRMQKVQEIKGKDKFQTFYRYFILTLFHEGFGKQKEDRDLDPELTELLGDVRYLNGGLFELHQLEQAYPDIDIPDKAFEKLFAFFDSYDWVLDTRPISDQKEINPDVLGYIFEKYINQKQMGAYYTKEDITDYISKNTIIPFLFDAAKKDCKVAFKEDAPLWALLSENPDAYIYPAVRHGVIDDKGEEIPLPKKIAAGIKDVKKRGDWNKAAATEFALPTETWREHVARRQRCLEIREKLIAGEVTEINDLITYNLDIRQFAEDAIRECEGSDLLKAFWNAIRKVTVLDPTCGSGAFLFAALDILKSLYETCLDRMHGFIDDAKRSGESAKKFKLFHETLNEIDQHPNLDYFILKSIIVNNLYGVDIMEEAVEICKLRMFLKLVSQIEKVDNLRPLPDIDFNVRSGNTLVGYSSVAEVRKSLEGTFGFEKEEVAKILEDAEVCENAFQKFQKMQTSYGYLPLEFAESKGELRRRLGELQARLDKFLSEEFGATEENFEDWRGTYEPFHWCIEFFGIMKKGFDVIVGNPPYLEKSKLKGSYSVHGYQTESCRDIYAWVVERVQEVSSSKGRTGLIVPVSIASSGSFNVVRDLLEESRKSLWLAHFANRPGQLFNGAQNRLSIVLQTPKAKSPKINSTRYHRWDARNGEREHIFDCLEFIEVTKLGRFFHGLLPKCGSDYSRNLVKAMKVRKTILDFTDSNSNFKIYWVRVPGYFCQFLLRAPMAYPDDGSPARERGEVNRLSFPSEDTMRLAHSILNSSFYHQFFCVYTDGRHINPSDVKDFPFDLGSVSKKASKKLVSLSRKLEDSMNHNTVRRNKSGLSIESVESKETKPVLDEIDDVIGDVLGLDEFAIDYAKNYNYKHRIGVEQ